MNATDWTPNDGDAPPFVEKYRAVKGGMQYAFRGGAIATHYTTGTVLWQGAPAPPGAPKKVSHVSDIFDVFERAGLPNEEESTPELPETLPPPPPENEGGVILTLHEPTPDPEVIARLEHLLALAKKGEIISFLALVSTPYDHKPLAAYQGGQIKTSKVVYHLECWKHRMIRRAVGGSGLPGADE